MLSLTNLTGFGAKGVTGVVETFGAFYAWGSNTYGQTGNNDTGTNPILVPTNTDTTPGISFTSRSFLSLHMGYLIGSDLYLAGYNQYGQLGQGDITALDEFTQVSTNGSNVTSFACGYYHTLSVIDGDVYGCGRDQLFQLAGNGNSTTFVVIADSTDFGGHNANKVYAGVYSSAVITTNNELYLWGENVGPDTSVSQYLTPINITDLAGYENVLDSSIVDVALGGRVAIFIDASANGYFMAYDALTDDGRPGAYPNYVDIIQIGTNVTKVATDSAVAYFIEDGILYQLPSSTPAHTVEDPVDIGDGITDWVNVQGGDQYIIAQRQDGTLYHRGLNTAAQQGNGSTGSETTELVLIDGGTTAISYGSYVTAYRTVYGIAAT